MAETSQMAGEVTDLFSVDALIEQRIFLHGEVGRAANAVVDANSVYHNIIVAIIALDEQLQQRDVDTTALRAQLYPPMPEQEIA